MGISVYSTDRETQEEKKLESLTNKWTITPEVYYNVRH